MAGLQGLKSLLLLTGLMTLAVWADETTKATTAPHSLASSSSATNSPDPRTSFSLFQSLSTASSRSEDATAPNSLPPSTNLPPDIHPNTTLPPRTNPIVPSSIHPEDNSSTSTNLSSTLPPRTPSHTHPTTNSFLDSLNSPTMRPTLAPVTRDSPNLISPSSTPLSSSPDFPPNTADSKHSPASTISPQTQNSTSTTKSVTIAPSAATSGTQGPTRLQCSLKVTREKFGFQLELSTGNDTGTGKSFTVNVTEVGPAGLTKTFNNLTPTNRMMLPFLKPCTEYELVAFTNEGDNSTRCEQHEMTTKMLKEDIEKVKSEHLCYRSQWDISSAIKPMGSLWCPPGKDCKNMSCINTETFDACTNLTTTFKPENCPDSAFNLTDFVYPTGKLLAPTRIPAKIEWPTEQQNCNDFVSLNYTCTENGQDQTIKLEKVEPYTSYSCKVQVKYDNIATDQELDFKIDCGLELEIKTQKNSNSLQMQWKTTSKNCSEAEHNKLQYYCICNSGNYKSKITNQKVCNISSLKPYTDYECEVQPRYNNKNLPKQPEYTQVIRTSAGVPDQLKRKDVEFIGNNAVIVKCDGPSSWNGEPGSYSAYLEGRQKNESRFCLFQFDDLSYLTKYKVVLSASNREQLSTQLAIEFDTRYNDKAVIGFLSFFIFVTSLALLCLLYKIVILQRRKSHDLNEHWELVPAANEEENLLNVEPIAAEVLLESYKSKIADTGRLFLAEFQSVPRVFTRYPVKEAKKPYNAYKNRYVDILPYDYNRVQLTTGNGETGYDYINASFIDGFKECKKYIAAQGPKEETVAHFWRMIWEQQSSIIVMVTRCVEGKRSKCAQYWPSSEREVELFDEFVVKLNREDHFPDYIISHLSLTNKRDKNTEREVTHIQFISWPDHGVPEEPHLLLKLRRRVNSFKNFFSGPIVIHCSAGVGRTGTYICIDAMMEGLEAEGRVDIYGYVVRLRRQRGFMVQVDAQYILIHQALIEYNQFGETEIVLSELHSILNMLKQPGSGTEPSLLEEEFQRLPKYRNWRTSYAANTEENKKKNRISSVIPYDFNRVLLRMEEDKSPNRDQDEDDEDESSDDEDESSAIYINASNIDGYWAPSSFITTQGPLPDTTADFWRMVYQKRAKTIVMLSNCIENDTEMCSPYWGTEKKTYEDFEVEVTATDTSSTFTTRTIQLRHTKRKDGRQVKQFHFLKWAGRELPENPKDLTDMIETIKKTCGYGNSKSERSTPIVVHCSNGSSRSGVFCALWNLLDSAETEKLVDVFQVVKALRKERQDTISSQEQYQFLYDALDGAFPAQNGEVKAATAMATETVQVVDELNGAGPTAEMKAGKQSEQASTTSGQKVAEVKEAVESTPLVADGGTKEEQKEAEGRKLSTEKMASEETTNGPIVTLEV